jgi:hypothetical protein
MRTDDVRTRTVLRNLVQRGRQLFLRRGDERRLIRSHTAGEQRLPRFPVTVRVGREKVHARKAVDLQVDEAWCSDPDSVGRAQTNAGDVTVDHVDVPENEAPVDERCPDSESHG